MISLNYLVMMNVIPCMNVCRHSFLTTIPKMYVSDDVMIIYILNKIKFPNYIKKRKLIHISFPVKTVFLYILNLKTQH